MAPTLVTETSLTLNNFHEHPLVRVEATMNVHDPPYQEFICDGCNTPGSGSVEVRYRCNQCPLFDLHEVCATCPKKLSTHIHPIHQMVLVWRPPTSETNDLQLAAGCHVCGDEVKGLYYTCLQLEPPEEDKNSTSSCKGIVLHPICSKFPLHVQQHVKDPHPLAFQKATASPCTICDKICDSWRYRCETCNTNIHPECVEPTVLVDESAKPSKQQRQPQQPSGMPDCIPVPFPMQQQQQQYYCHQEKRPAADSGYPRPQPPQPPQQLVPMHQQWHPNNNYGAHHPPQPMHHPHHHHLQYFYPPYPYHLYNTYLQQIAAAYPYNTYLQQTAAAYLHYTYLQQTAAAYQAEGGASSSGGGKKKRRMFLVVGKIIATMALTTAFGIPYIPS